MRERSMSCFKNMWHKAVISVLVLAVVVMFIPLQVLAENITTGTMGATDGITWTYDADTDTLTLSGKDSGLNGNKEDGSIFVKKFGLIRKIILDDFTVVGSAQYLFANLSDLESIEMKKVDTSQVTNMNQMFENCSSLTALDLSRWNTSEVTNMASMFNGCSSLTTLDISKFDTSKVTSFYWLFRGCSNLESVNLGKISTSQVKNMEKMFSGCDKLKKVDLSNFDTSKVTSMGGLFENCASLEEVDLSGLETDSLINMPNMFSGCSSLTEVDISNFNTSGITSMYGLFHNCSSLTSVKIRGIDTSQVTNMERMFFGCSSLKQINLNGLDTSEVTNMVCMFKDCSSLVAVDLSSLDTSKVTKMASLFEGCNSLMDVDLDGLDTSGVTSMYAMFKGCSMLSELDLSSFVASRVTNADSMLRDCDSLEKVVTPKEMNDECPIALPVTYYDLYSKGTDSITNDFCKTTLTKTRPINPFADVKEDSWKYVSVKYVYDNGLMTGKGDDENGKVIFHPDVEIPREEFVQVLFKASGKPFVSIENKFPDVKDAWYKDAVLWANANGIVSGTGDGNFGVTESILRQDLALMLYKYAHLNGYDLTANSGEIDKYADGNKVGSYAKTAMDWAITNGIMSGKGKAGEDISTFKLDPTGTATRAECAAMIMKFMDMYGK